MMLPIIGLGSTESALLVYSQHGQLRPPGTRETKDEQGPQVPYAAVTSSSP